MSLANNLERYMLTLLNEERASRDLGTLVLEQRLNDAAEDHSTWMLNEDIFSHTGVDDSTATDRILEADFGLSGPWITAENLAVQSERGEFGYFDDVYDLHLR